MADGRFCLITGAPPPVHTGRRPAKSGGVFCVCVCVSLQVFLDLLVQVKGKRLSAPLRRDDAAQYRSGVTASVIRGKQRHHVTVHTVPGRSITDARRAQA